MPSENAVCIHWFRKDLRLSDNPALCEAARNGTVYPIYILEDENAGEWRMGAASRVWLHHSLNRLNESLGGNLNIYRGDASDIIETLTKRVGAKAVYWNRSYEPWRIAHDKKLKASLKEQQIHAESFNGSLLWEPWQVEKQSGGNYKVFTPFYRKGCLNAHPPREPLDAPHSLTTEKDTDSLTLDDLKLLPSIRWDAELIADWEVGEEGAKKRLKHFLHNGIASYKEGRNFPALNAVSRLSPRLHFGELSPNQLWYAARHMGDNQQIDHFCSELGWREFSHSLLYYFPDLPSKNLMDKFDRFPWNDDDDALKRWQRGMTGYPIVDAGMRELWQTGYMHNRVRMIVGSFLVKNLLIHWHEGEKWFWDCLLDADLANNSASWQWVAGCGADAAPYFRIFNPITQGEKFDAKGEYTRQFVPELKHLPDKYLYAPWKAPKAVLEKAGIVLGKDYPKPIVDIASSRDRALAAFKSLAGNDQE